jgi:hypothetical protein
MLIFNELRINRSPRANRHHKPDSVKFRLIYTAAPRPGTNRMPLTTAELYAGRGSNLKLMCSRSRTVFTPNVGNNA